MYFYRYPCIFFFLQFYDVLVISLILSFIFLPVLPPIFFLPWAFVTRSLRCCCLTGEFVLFHCSLFWVLIFSILLNADSLELSVLNTDSLPSFCPKYSLFPALDPISCSFFLNTDSFQLWILNNDCLQLYFLDTDSFQLSIVNTASLQYSVCKNDSIQLWLTRCC